MAIEISHAEVGRGAKNLCRMLREARDETVATHDIQMELMDNIKQISTYVFEIARSIVYKNN